MRESQFSEFSEFSPNTIDTCFLSQAKRQKYLEIIGKLLKLETLKPSIVVYSGYFNKVLKIGWLINNRHLLLRVLETKNLNLGVNMVEF